MKWILVDGPGGQQNRPGNVLRQQARLLTLTIAMICLAPSFPSNSVGKIMAQDSPVASREVAENSGAEQPSVEKNVTAAAARQHLILVVGAPGTEEYAAIFHTWALRWQKAANGVEVDVTVAGLEVSPANDAAAAEEKSTDSDTPAEAVTAELSDRQKVLDTLNAAGSIVSTEPLWLVFIGHGTFDGRTASWNLRGPDLSADHLAEACLNVQRPLVVVACASCTSPFINALSGPGRVIITATKDGNQMQYNRFGDAMSQAVSTLAADINRDGQTSLLEAWLFASRRTAEFYKTEGRLATEHSLLDDNGDAKGTRAELFEGDHPATNVENPEQLDGRIAARWHLVRSEEERRLTIEQRQARDALEARILQLRSRHDSLEESDYLQQLEALMLPLARIYKEADAAAKPVSEENSSAQGRR